MKYINVYCYMKDNIGVWKRCMRKVYGRWYKLLYHFPFFILTLNRRGIKKNPNNNYFNLLIILIPKNPLLIFLFIFTPFLNSTFSLFL
jgi:hypothetical protein